MKKQPQQQQQLSILCLTTVSLVTLKKKKQKEREAKRVENLPGGSKRNQKTYAGSVVAVNQPAEQKVLK